MELKTVTDRRGSATSVTTSGDEVQTIVGVDERSSALFYTPAQARELAAALLRAADEAEGVTERGGVGSNTGLGERRTLNP